MDDGLSATGYVQEKEDAHDGGVKENSCGLGSVAHQYVTGGESMCLSEPPLALCCAYEQ